MTRLFYEHGMDASDPRTVVEDGFARSPSGGASARRALRTAGCARVPLGGPTGCLGTCFQAVLATRAGGYRLRKRQIQPLVSDLFALSISTGMVSKLERQSSVALEAPYNELATSVHGSEVANIDETSWRENRRKAWLWATVTGLCTVFTIANSRSGEIPKALLGSKGDQVVGTGRFIA